MTSAVVGRSMVRAWLKHSGPHLVGSRCHFCVRTPLTRHAKAGVSLRPETCRSVRDVKHKYVQTRQISRHKSRTYKCFAGMTASYENTQTHTSDPSRTVTEAMFSRAERYASTAGPGDALLLSWQLRPSLNSGCLFSSHQAKQLA